MSLIENASGKIDQLKREGKLIQVAKLDASVRESAERAMNEPRMKAYVGEATSPPPVIEPSVEAPPVGQSPMKTFLIAASSFCLGAVLMHLYVGGPRAPSETTGMPRPEGATASPATVSGTSSAGPTLTPIGVSSARAADSPAVAALRAEATTLVNQWAVAWSARDVDRYLAFYAKEFSPPEKLSREAWEAQRRQRILGKQKIVVDVYDVAVEPLNENRAMVRFAQSYEADNIRESRKPKMMVLAREGGTWRIAEEMNARGKPASRKR